ncbi:DUF916 domain-containing protein [Micromonospora sp. NPDC048999]|uniref:WxL protein peptidoglycan domain-containing protein n=1 Tax=Micromonospora sp. NPDC048999 TaxID=3155391 RepID=UPI0033F30663
MPLVTFFPRIRSRITASPDATASRAASSPLTTTARIGALLGASLLALVLAPPAVAGAAAAPGAAAQSTESWAVQPSGPKGPTGRNFFMYEVAPGSTLFDFVGVTNLSDKPLTFKVYGTDAFNTVDGAFALLPADQKATDVGSWVRVEQQTVTVKPGKRADIRFEITVPSNATPGDHTGGVLAAIGQLGVTPEGQQVQMDRRVAARVYLRVTGKINPAVTVESMNVDYHAPLNPFGGSDMVVTYQLRNSGNVRIGGKGTVNVTGPFGWKLARNKAVDLPELLPGSVFTVTERVAGVSPAVRLSANVDLALTTGDEKLPRVTHSASVWAMPWLLLIPLALIAGWVYLRIRRRRAAKKAATGQPAPAEAPTQEPAASRPAVEEPVDVA